VRERPPLVPVTVSVRAPRVVFELVDTVSVEPAPVVELGLNDALERFGSPLTLNATEPVNPPVRFTATEYVVDWPRLTLRLVGVALSVKLGASLGVPATAV